MDGDVYTKHADGTFEKLNPAPVLFVFPTEKDAISFSKARVQPIKQPDEISMIIPEIEIDVETALDVVKYVEEGVWFMMNGQGECVAKEQVGPNRDDVLMSLYRYIISVADREADKNAASLTDYGDKDTPCQE